MILFPGVGARPTRRYIDGLLRVSDSASFCWLDRSTHWTGQLPPVVTNIHRWRIAYLQSMNLAVLTSRPASFRTAPFGCFDHPTLPANLGSCI